ncbi:PD-(D/E)XK motif protein [Salinimonas marina]|uniref:PD-(D/E)XK motif protein n=1 Tax=Salinimonas marina TaxID=2785918 RepID=A0A7S9DXF7_9ALTE|nr:PD-(D/E)XK motif protein [Salinimonas marina]QPG05739.1 PD-(D/E)XK motif protein [Salinimonas marina]
MNDFTLKWQEHSSTGKSAGVFRVFPDNPFDFFIGFSECGCREFYFSWESLEPEKISELSLKNIQLGLEKSGEEYTLKLTLLENDYKDLFSVVCVDLAKAVENVKSLNIAISIVYRRLLRWSDLLSRSSKRTMTLNEQRGLIGELSLLKLILKKESFHTASVINGWRGPEGDTNDLSINGVRVEVKAQLASQAKGIRVSSLQQLEDDKRELFVSLFRLSPAEKGASLKSLITDIESIVAQDIELLFEFRRKYLLSGYDSEADYAETTYNVPEPTLYGVADGFPRLTPENVPPGVSAASYFIDAQYIKPFEVLFEYLESLING